MDFGQLSFRKGGEPIVGLPLDVIDKVGTTLTERYHKNRTGAQVAKEKALNLPDANSEANRKIIEDISNQVDGMFSKYKEDGSWSQADDAVYDAADMLVSNPDVKALYKYAGQAAKVEEVIDKSEAPEVYKQLRRAKNQALNKGIKDEQGNYVGYQGKGINKDLDMTAEYKKYAELTAGWQADAKSYAMNPKAINIEGMSVASQAIYNQFGTIDVEKVDKAEVEEFLMNIVTQDANVKAKVYEIAELELFRDTGKLNADAQVVREGLTEAAYTVPEYREMILSRSADFVKETKGMTPEGKARYISKINSNPAILDQYIAQGMDDYMSKIDAKAVDNPGYYDKIFYGMADVKFNSTIGSIADKAAYTREKMNQQILANPLARDLFKKQMEDLNSHSLVSKAGDISADNVGVYLDAKNGFETELSAIEADINSGKFSGVALEDKKRQRDAIEGKIKSNDLFIDTFRQQSGITDDAIITRSGDIIKAGIDQIARTNFIAGSPSAIGMSPSNSSLKNGDVDKIFNIIKSNPDASTGEISHSLRSMGIDFGTDKINRVKKIVASEIKEGISSALKAKGIDAVAMPVFRIGSIGANPFVYERTINSVKEMLSAGAGDFTVITAGEDHEDFINLPNQGLSLQFNKVMGKNNIPMDSEMILEPALVSDGSGKQYFVTTNTRTKERMLLRYDGNQVISSDFNNEIFHKSVNNYFAEDNYNAATDLESAKNVAGFIGGDIKVSKVGVNGVNGTTLRDAVRLLPKKGNSNEYADLTVPIGMNTFRIETVEHKGRVHQQIYDENNNPMFTQIDANGNVIPRDVVSDSPNGILQYMGAAKYVSDAKAKGDFKTVNNIMNLFDLNPRK